MPVRTTRLTTGRLLSRYSPNLRIARASQGRPYDCGTFGYQDGLDWVHVVDGSESNVVGLPMELLAEMLRPYCR